MTLAVLREPGVVESVNTLCPGEHAVSHGEIVNLLTVHRLHAPRPLYRFPDWFESTGLATASGV